eukprot:2201431-Alexandrium_andersonii.AAC.1
MQVGRAVVAESPTSTEQGGSSCLHRCGLAASARVRAGVEPFRAAGSKVPGAAVSPSSSSTRHRH